MSILDLLKNSAARVHTGKMLLCLFLGEMFVSSHEGQRSGYTVHSSAPAAGTDSESESH